ncbi:MAG: sensor domain-containing diguanylate cyclase [Methylobacterium sp.]
MTLTTRSSISPIVWLRLGVAALCVLLAASAGWTRWIDREQRFAKAEGDASILARSLAHHATDLFLIGGLISAELADAAEAASAASPSTPTLELRGPHELARLPLIRSLEAFDADGRSLTPPKPGLSAWTGIAEEPFFLERRFFPGTDLRIAEPVQGPGGEGWVIPITRRWNMADGSFGGVVVARISSQALAGFYHDFDADGHAGISLLTDSGTLLARYPLAPERIGRLSGTLKSLDGVRLVEKGTFRRPSPIDGVWRILAFQHVDGLPLVVLVGIGYETALAGWWPATLLVGLGTLFLAMLLLGACLVLERYLASNRSATVEMQHLAVTDALTGLGNRRAFDEACSLEWDKAAAMGQTLSMLLIDVDHFKSFNDTYGHPAGDVCLRRIAQTLETTVFGVVGRLARYGGEEFALLLVDVTPSVAVLLADHLRVAIQNLDLAHEGNETGVATVSVGVAAIDPREAGSGGLAKLVKAADEALYRAKAEGRNCVREAVKAVARPGVPETANAA